MNLKKVTRSKSKACSVRSCKATLHHKDWHTKCVACLSPKHSDNSHKYNLCQFCREMSPSQYRARGDRRKALLGGQSPARFLVSLGTGDPGSSVAEETEREAAPPPIFEPHSGTS